jgi:hypothetical protein
MHESIQSFSPSPEDAHVEARAIKGVKAVFRVPVDQGGEGVAVVAEGYCAADRQDYARAAFQAWIDTPGIRRPTRRPGAPRVTRPDD